MNLTVLPGIWLALDVVYLLTLRRGSPLPMPLVVFGQLLVGASAVLALWGSDMGYAVGFWCLAGLVNGLLALQGYATHRGVAVAGAGATVVAIVLILIRSFVSLPVIVVAAVLCLGAAVVPSGDRSAEKP